MPSKSLLILKFASKFVEILPLSLAIKLSEFVGSNIFLKLSSDKAAQLKNNLQKVQPRATAIELDVLVKAGFGSYARYWAESFSLPKLHSKDVIANFVVDGYENIESVYESGFSPILALPHLGGWEWGAAWLCYEKNLEVAAVVEKLEPEDVFEWFKNLRSSYGIDVIGLDNKSFSKLTKALNNKKVVCLLSDRDISGTGVKVDFFDQKVKMPSGPALLSYRSGCPILPTAVYFDGSKRVAEVGIPIWPKKSGNLKDDLKNTTQLVTNELEDLIRKAPEQWHVLNPLFDLDVN